MAWASTETSDNIEQPLLILDIDETLIHGIEQPLERECDLRAGEFYAFLRPHVSEFLTAVSSCKISGHWKSDHGTIAYRTDQAFLNLSIFKLEAVCS